MKTGLLKGGCVELVLVCNSLSDKGADEMCVAEADGIAY